MKKNSVEILITIFFIVLLNYKSFAQCSDAGICQVGGHLMDTKEYNSLDITAAYKYGYSGKEDDVQFNSLLLNGNYNLLNNSTLQFLIPYNIQSGPNGNVNGIGDLIISWDQKLISDENSSLNASLGVKLASGSDNEKNLPQVYQSGLGTNDLLIAVNYSYNKFILSAGYQMVGGRNDNVLKLKKGDDLLLRGAYELSIEEFNITPQLLFIKRLSKSSIIDSSSSTENYIEVDGSDQAQLNLLTVLEYNFGGVYSLVGEFAIPFLKREVNVDGLTRVFSASVGVKLSVN